MNQPPSSFLPNTNNYIRRNPKPPKSAAAPQPSRSHGSTTQACAACKYQRRKCASDCILAPYFPHDSHRQFLNAHRLFGVSNIVKIVRHLDPAAKDQAMRSIIYQSDARAADPVGGCYRIIRDLENRIAMAKAEHEIVLHHLALFRAAATATPLQTGDCYAAVEDVNSWPLETVQTNAESVSSSFPCQQETKNSPVEDCNNADLIQPILDQLDCDGDIGNEDVSLKFDFDGNLISSVEEKEDFKEEDDDCFGYVDDHEDLKAAATFFSLTNCDI